MVIEYAGTYTVEQLVDGIWWWIVSQLMRPVAALYPPLRDLQQVYAGRAALHLDNAMTP